jgi:hypothetical protein
MYCLLCAGIDVDASAAGTGLTSNVAPHSFAPHSFGSLIRTRRWQGLFVSGRFSARWSAMAPKLGCCSMAGMFLSEKGPLVQCDALHLLCFFYEFLLGN